MERIVGQMDGSYLALKNGNLHECLPRLRELDRGLAYARDGATTRNESVWLEVVLRIRAGRTKRIISDENAGRPLVGLSGFSGKHKTRRRKSAMLRRMTAAITLLWTHSSLLSHYAFSLLRKQCLSAPNLILQG